MSIMWQLHPTGRMQNDDRMSGRRAVERRRNIFKYFTALLNGF